jgi:hypothetical protein
MMEWWQYQDSPHGHTDIGFVFQYTKRHSLKAERDVKRAQKYEVIAAILAVVGAIALAGVYYPIINRDQFSMDFERDSMPVSWYILGTPASLCILAAAWRFNCKAERMKQEERGAQQEGPAA